MLLPADLTSTHQERLLPELPQQPVDLLVLSHHGARDGTSDLLLSALRPKAALISAGKKNLYGHPHAEVLELLAAREIPAWSTRENGTFTITKEALSWLR